MKEEVATDALLRQFLLGKIDDEERQRIESLFLTDSAMKERVLAAEQELIDDYLEDCLSPADRETFLSLYGDTASQQRKLRIAKSIQEWAGSQPQTPVTTQPAVSAWSRLLERLRVKPVLVIPIAVAATVAIVVSIVWVNSRRTDQAEYLAMQRELDQLNTPSSLREVLPVASVVTLKPGTVRNAEGASELRRGSDNSLAELHLLWLQDKDYPSYHAVLRRSGAERSYTISNLTVEKEGRFIRVRLRLDRLTPGDYDIELTGAAADGTKSPPEVYSVTVSE